MVQRRHANWTIAIPMIVGAIPGAYFGGQFVSILPGTALTLVIGLFVLATTWVRLPKQDINGPITLGLVGGAIGAVGMVVSATGPLTSLFLSRNPDRRVVVATHATIMTAQHLSKIVVFVMLGFAIGPWLVLAAAMIMSGFAGTLVGTRLLERLPEKLFRFGLKALLTLIALGLVVRGLGF